MLKELKNYILESEFKTIILKNKINIVNYEEIDHFDDNKIMIRFKEGLIIIKGENLIISKLLDNELLINGKINNLEFR